jgi:hypothetical protein
MAGPRHGPDLELHLIGPLQSNKAGRRWRTDPPIDRDKNGRGRRRATKRAGPRLRPGQYRRRTAEGRPPAGGDRGLRHAAAGRPTGSRSTA